MAWRSTGISNAELIANLARNGVFRSDRVANAMNKVDRANYVRNKWEAYQDCPQSIGYGSTISAPHMHAYAAEYLLPFLRPGSRVLDVGSGSGYLCAIFYRLASSEDTPGKIVGIEHIPELVGWSIQNLNGDGLEREVDGKHIVMMAGDGRLGYPEGGPYDAIHVGAAAPTVPDALIEQLASPGRMFIPVGTYSQCIYQIDKDVNGEVSKKALMGVSYVPLTDRPDTKY